MPSTGYVLAVLGSGPGIGSATAKAFAKTQRFAKIAMVSRDAARLNAEKAEVQKAGGNKVEVAAFPADLSDLSQLRSTLKEIEKMGSLGGIFFNAARIKPTDILTTSVEEIAEDFKTTNLALYTTAQWAIPLLQKSGSDNPLFFVTNTFLVEKPLPFLLSLSAVKASQQTMVMTFNDAFGKDIHLGLIKVLGVVSPEAKNLNPPKIADDIVTHAEKPKGSWELVTNLDE